MAHSVLRAVSLLAFLSAGCASMSPPPPIAAVPELPPMIRSATLAKEPDFLIVRAGAGDTYASLARTHLGDAALANVLSEANGARALETGRPVVVPRKASNASGVFADGYQTVPILCYHQFTAGRSADLMVMPRDSFAQQMAYLRDNDYHVISLADLRGFLAGSTPIPPRSVVLTIDDGFRSAYEIAYPILKSY